MAKKQTNTITINGTDYTEDQLTESQKVMVNHVADLDRKIGSANFNLDQLKMGRMAFMQSLNASLEVKEAAE
jgi:cell division protein ZapA (FtsZ GTPase activity inhibitor)